MNGNLGRTLALVLFFSLAALGCLQAQDSATPGKSRVEVVFCLDTTGSMGGLIAGAQQKIWSLVNGIATGKPVPEGSALPPNPLNQY
ncbi:MAG TPA: hypothetical protein PKO06_21760, partial [Candidatus Ozemobacteraceae bacterium]|nr:hypothetical protein [Candidatus Ozemobacteraceae bacterium]